jgi:hypothetical protein
MVAQRKYPEELRERAVKMVLEVRERGGEGARGAGPGGQAAGCSPGGAAVLDEYGSSSS